METGLTEILAGVSHVNFSLIWHSNNVLKHRIIQKLIWDMTAIETKSNVIYDVTNSTSKKTNEISVACILENERNMVLMYCIPSHPKTSLTRCYRWWVFTRVFRGGVLCQYSCCLTCDVFIKLNKLVQIHDSWCFHNATAFVNLKIQRKWKKKSIISLINFFPEKGNKYLVKHPIK